MSKPPKKPDQRKQKPVSQVLSRPTSGKSVLSTEDEALWQQVISSVKPLEGRKIIGTDADDSPFMQQLHKASKAYSQKVQDQKVQDMSFENRLLSHSGHYSGPYDHHHSDDHEGADQNKTEPKQGLKKTPAEIAKFDHKLFRKLGTERIEIDARLDLHGLRQDQAYSSLKLFLRQAQSQAFRNVLVITGKGAPKNVMREFEMGEEKPGVLKRLVPEWLQEEDFRQWVVSYTTAPAQHGGEGALYVKIRRGR